MKRLFRLPTVLGLSLRWLFGSLVAVFLAVMLGVQLPAVQRRMASYASGYLSAKLGTSVEISRIELGLSWRLVVDGLAVSDQSSRPMLSANRVTAQVSLLEALRGKIRLGHVGLFGLEAHVWRDGEAMNFQFVVDSLSSKDSTKHTPLDLSIGQVVVRRATLTYDSLLCVSPLNLTAELHTLTDDSISLTLRRLDAREQRRGIALNKATGQWACALPDWQHSAFALTLDAEADAYGSVRLAASGAPDSISVERLVGSYVPLCASADVSGTLLGLATNLDSLRLRSDIVSAELTVPRLGTLRGSGYVEGQPLQRTGLASLSLQSDYGAASVEAEITGGDAFTADVETARLAHAGLGSVSGNISVMGSITERSGTAVARLAEASYKGYTLRNVTLDVETTGLSRFWGDVAVNDPSLCLTASGSYGGGGTLSDIMLSANVADFCPEAFGLVKGNSGVRLSAYVDASVQDSVVDVSASVGDFLQLCLNGRIGDVVSLDARASHTDELGELLGSKAFFDTDLALSASYDFGGTFDAAASFSRKFKDTLVGFSLTAAGDTDSVSSALRWEHPTYAGELGVVARFAGDTIGVSVMPADISAAGDVWHLGRSALSYAGGVLTVDSLSISSGDRGLQVSGRASKAESDTLRALVSDVELEDVFTLVRFHDVEFRGLASGVVTGHSLFSNPVADADMHVPNFCLNDAQEGPLNIKLNWGHRPYSIRLDAEIEGTEGAQYVNGYITPKKDVAYHGVDLDIRADHVNASFIDKYTQGIFERLEATASGWAHLFGPFKGIDVEGRIMIDRGALTIPTLGVRYTLEGDSLMLDPGRIYFQRAEVFDPLGHVAYVDGDIRHRYFGVQSYDIHVTGSDLLAYNFPVRDELPFWGTVYATGDVHLYGIPGRMTADIDARPQQGTWLMYDFAGPDQTTGEASQLLQFVDRSGRRDTALVATTPTAVPQQTEGDVRLNFNLDVTPASQLQLLMDARTNDILTLLGRGKISAQWHNRGAMQAYGTYHIERGTYGLTLQDIIHKRFNI